FYVLLLSSFLFYFLFRPLPSSTLFPYTTLFRSKFVIVRGIGERYNAAALDGTVLPSTEAQRRSFSFDMIPNAKLRLCASVLGRTDRKSTRLNSSHVKISYAVFCLKKKKKKKKEE